MGDEKVGSNLVLIGDVVSSELNNLLHDFISSVLTHKPDDVFLFSRNKYFGTFQSFSSLSPTLATLLTLLPSLISSSSFLFSNGLFYFIF